MSLRRANTALMLYKHKITKNRKTLFVYFYGNMTNKGGVPLTKRRKFSQE